MKLLGVYGSLQAESGNLILLHRARALLSPGVELQIFLGVGDLPHFNPDLDGTAIDAVTRWREALATSDALLIACPEYGHSLPGALKNAIDWVIGTAELEGKVCAITASTPHRERGRMGLAALRTTLSAVSAVIVGGEPIARGPSFDEEVGRLLDALVSAARRGPGAQAPNPTDISATQDGRCSGEDE